MSPLAGGRHGSPVLSPTASLDRPSASLQRMYSMDLPTVSVGPTVVQHPPGMSLCGSVLLELCNLTPLEPEEKRYTSVLGPVSIIFLGYIMFRFPHKP